MTKFTADIAAAERFLDQRSAEARRDKLRAEIGELGAVQTGQIGGGLYVVYAEGHGWIDRMDGVE